LISEHVSLRDAPRLCNDTNPVSVVILPERMHQSIIVIVGARTPIGGERTVRILSSPQLAAVAIKATVAQSGLESKDINEAIIGCVLPAAVGQAPARQAILGAGLLNSTACATLNKVCGSGMKAAMLAYDQILAGSANVMIAGGMESMSNAPHMLPKARQG
jgi:acetyl-CoA C-acetyltransferase